MISISRLVKVALVALSFFALSGVGLIAKKDDRPFVAYLAFTAPQDLLHVPDSWLDQYSGTYKEPFK